MCAPPLHWWWCSLTHHWFFRSKSAEGQRGILNDLCDALSANQLTALYHCLYMLQTTLPAGEQDPNQDARSMHLSGLQIQLLVPNESSLDVQQYASNVGQFMTVLKSASANAIGEMIEIIETNHPRVLIPLRLQNINRPENEIVPRQASRILQALASPNPSPEGSVATIEGSFGIFSSFGYSGYSGGSGSSDNSGSSENSVGAANE